MKKLASVFCALALLLSLGACSTPSEEGQTELIVFAAASLQETLQQAADAYTKEHPGVTITCSFDSSGTLKSQIAEGAVCDLFLSAAPKQMNELAELGFIDEDSRTDLLENKVVLVVPEGNPSAIESFAALAQNEFSLLAIGNADVPVGQYSLEIFDYLSLSIELLERDGKLTYGSNVKEVVTQVAEGAVDAGIVYATDAYSARLTVVDEATGEMCSRVVYPAAVLSASESREAAVDFLDYLSTDDAMEIFASVGFSAAD